MFVITLRFFFSVFAVHKDNNVFVAGVVVEFEVLPDDDEKSFPVSAADVGDAGESEIGVGGRVAPVLLPVAVVFVVPKLAKAANAFSMSCTFCLFPFSLSLLESIFESALRLSRKHSKTFLWFSECWFALIKFSSSL